MFLLDTLRRILCCFQDEQEQDSYRNHRDYTSFSPLVPKTRSSPQNHVYRDKSVLPDVTSSQGNGNRTIFSKVSSPSFSSLVGDSSIPASFSSAPFFGQVPSTNCNDSLAGLSIGPEKFQIKKNSATCSPERPSAASQLSKFHCSLTSSSSAPVPMSQKPTFAPASTADNIGSARASQLSNAPSRSISSSAAPAPSSKKLPLTSASSTIYTISTVGPFGPEKLAISPDRPGVATLLSKCDSLYTSSSTKDSISPAQQSKVPSSKKPSLASVSSATSKAPVGVWKGKSQIRPDSTTKLAEKPSLSSPSLPSSKKDANNFVSWHKDKQTSMEADRESVQKLPAFFPSLLESGISNRRVLPKYEIPKYLEEMIRNDIVPPILKRPLSPSTYRDFFGTLLYAEDFYVEKWSKYLLEGIKLDLQRRIISKNSQESSMKRKNTMLTFVAFEIDSVPERRPYLLSRDFVFLKPLNEIAGPFKGKVFRVEKSTTVLVEFGDDFHSQYSPFKRYDVSFSFNRVCLKRAHQAISAASDPSFHNILFPDQIISYNAITSPFIHENTAKFQDHARNILNHKGPIPYLVNGPLVVGDTCLSSTGLIVQEAMLNIYKTNPCCRILVCAPTNNTADVLLRSLKKEIPESGLFRANAAYRDYDLVPHDIIPSSLYEEDGECFACPPLAELIYFNIITCTFMSTFRLYAAGLDSEHFTHIFLVDTSLATEPEAVVPLAHFVGRNTVVVVTGCSDKFPSYVRADIARMHGLKVSYFNRLLVRAPYVSNDSMFIAHVA